MDCKMHLNGLPRHQQWEILTEQLAGCSLQVAWSARPNRENQSCVPNKALGCIASEEIRRCQNAIAEFRTIQYKQERYQVSSSA